MTIADWVMVVAVLTGPLIAVQLTRYLDRKREIRERKLSIFQTLMATRSYTITWAHVEALNRIDLEFDKNEKKERAVLDSWKEYLDHLGQTQIPVEQWAIKRIDLLVEMLHRMATVLDYDFDKTHIKNSSYSPMAHGAIEEEFRLLRQGAIEILQGKRSLPIHVADDLPRTPAVQPGIVKKDGH
ncbi:MAG: DUF6680 family protein [Elusimicrobiota bacterium]